MGTRPRKSHETIGEREQVQRERELERANWDREEVLKKRDKE